MKTPIVFNIYRDDALVATKVYNQDIIKVGTIQSSHMRLDDPNVSRMHAVIERTDHGAVFIIDLGSHAGVIVNDRKVTKAQLLDNDKIRFGDTTVTMRMADTRGVQLVLGRLLGSHKLGEYPEEWQNALPKMVAVEYSHQLELNAKNPVPTSVLVDVTAEALVSDFERVARDFRRALDQK